MKVLVIDEKNEVAEVLAKGAGRLGVTLRSATGLGEGLATCRSDGFDIVLMRDIVSGIASSENIQDFQNTFSSPEVLIYAAEGNPQHAEQALVGGAWDYCVDPSPEKKLPDLLRRVVRYRRNKKRGWVGKQQGFFKQLHEHGIIGSSAAIQHCLDLVARVGQSDSSVLITGETGTGKELFASAIHNISARSSGNLTIIDCAALPSTLVESILFGHARGSFTGADRKTKGLIKQADGGTLFLDEIGEMPLEIQKKFLRVLQEQEYLPVGSSTSETSDFRLIAATNKDLDVLVERGEFREDLHFRLKTFELELPPLRTRKTDISELAYYFRNRYSKRNKLKKKKLSTDFMMILSQYDWPGNVRELFQAIEYSIANASESMVLESAHLPVNIRLAVTKKKLVSQSRESDLFPEIGLPDDSVKMPTLKEDRENAVRVQEKRYLLKLLKMTRGNVKQCCEIAGLSRSRLYDLLKKYDLSLRNPTGHSAERKNSE